MKIKKFQAKTVKEALAQIKKTLGPDALVLSIKKQGLINKYVEVTAAIDDPMDVMSDAENGQFNPMHELNAIQDEIREIKDIIKSFIPVGSFKEGVFPFFQQVKKRGLSEEIALKLIEALEEGILTEGFDRNVSLKDFLYELLCKLVDVLPPIEQTDKRIAMVIGPPGVGKTSIIAKLAGQLITKGKIGLISLNDRPVGSLVMEYYAQMLQLPLAMVNDPTELIKSINSYADKDFILIDTPGLIPNDMLSRQRLIKHLRTLNQTVLNYMVLDVTMKDEEILHIIQGFQPIGISALIFTKIDEADALGTIFNQMIYTGKPLSYLGTGPVVPEDIELVTPYRLMDLIINYRSDNNVERSKKIYKSGK